MEATARKESQEKPKSYKFSLKTPYLEKGRITNLVAETENLWIHTKINAEGGENAIHAHLDEDHSFIVLEGEMTVFDEAHGLVGSIRCHPGFAKESITFQTTIRKGAHLAYEFHRSRGLSSDVQSSDAARPGTTA